MAGVDGEAPGGGADRGDSAAAAGVTDPRGAASAAAHGEGRVGANQERSSTNVTNLRLRRNRPRPDAWPITRWRRRKCPGNSPTKSPRNSRRADRRVTSRARADAVRISWPKCVASRARPVPARGSHCRVETARRRYAL